MPYAEFVRSQVAGDLMPPPRPGGINKDGLVATGLLALADFVPGDVDKDQMIADYVNDEIDVVGRAFLGLSIACARCHDHKFDPISADDYYALAGIFFSTSLVPGPVPGNTPLVRVPLVPPDELARSQGAGGGRQASTGGVGAAVARFGRPRVHRPCERTRRRTDRSVPHVGLRVPEPGRRASQAPPGELSSRRMLEVSLLTAWIDFLGRIASSRRRLSPDSARRRGREADRPGPLPRRGRTPAGLGQGPCSPRGGIDPFARRIEPGRRLRAPISGR